MAKYLPTDENRFKARQEEVDRFRAMVDQMRRKLGIAPDANKVVPLDQKKKEQS